jgi:lipopolysaccharide/colanic/teichoic acid biosynthesis glycosyltransferase
VLNWHVSATQLGSIDEMIRLFRVSIPAGVLALLASEIALTTFCFVAAAYLVVRYEVTTYFLDEGGLARTALVVLSIILGLHFSDLYTRIRVKSRTRLLQDLSQVIGIALLAQGLISYATPKLILGRGIMLVGTILCFFVLFLWRLFFEKFILDAVAGDRILFVGINPVVREMAGYISRYRELGLSIAGYVVNGVADGAPLTGPKALGSIADLRKIVAAVKPSRIVVGMTGRRDRMPVPELLDLRFAGFAIDEAGSAYEAVCSRICAKELRPGQLIFSDEFGPRLGGVFIQNVLNFSVSIVGVLLTMPVMAVVALAVRLNSRGPILDRLTRVGKNGTPFTLFRFRPTPKVVRRLRLDALPQLFNVLRGEISLVGPRPERPEFVTILSGQIPYYRLRHSVKPGLTGWAQLNHDDGDTLEDTVTRLEYDLYYIKNIAPSLDAYIIFHTLKTMVVSRGRQ